MGWIDVKDKLPPFLPRKNHSATVLVWGGKSVTTRQFYIGPSGWGVKPVTHWMPLPSPPDSRP